MGTLPPTNTLEDVKIRIRQANQGSNVGLIKQVVLKDGPQTHKIATLIEILNNKTNQHHHYTLKIDQVKKSKAGWTYQQEKSIRLDGRESDEIKILYTFLEAEYKNKLNNELGEVHVINSSEYDKISNLISLIPTSNKKDQFSLLGSLVTHIDSSNVNLSEFISAFESGNADILKHISSAAKIVSYKTGINELKNLIRAENTLEKEFQQHLEANPWMFGSEYSQRLERKTWTRDDRLDFMMRKTADDYVEIIEIKKAFSENLFNHDTSHDCYHPSAKLSSAIGQVVRYIEEIERSRDNIMATAGYDTLKIRAKIIIGRNNDNEQIKALRNLNSHLHRIEVMTYDQLIKISERILDMFDIKSDAEPDVFDWDIPF